MADHSPHVIETMMVVEEIVQPVHMVALLLVDGGITIVFTSTSTITMQDHQLTRLFT